MKFENNLLEQQLNETKMRKQIEISEMDGKLQDQYEEKLQQSLTVSKMRRGQLVGIPRWPNDVVCVLPFAGAP